MAQPVRDRYDEENQEDFYNSKESSQKFGVIDGNGKGDGKPSGKLESVKESGAEDEDFMGDIANVADDEKKSLEDRGFLVNDAPSEGFMRSGSSSKKGKQGFVKKAAKKRTTILISGVAISVGGGILGFILSILPFELQHIKNVFQTEIGGVTDTVITTRQGRLLSRSFFFHGEPGNQVFDGYKQRGMVATLTGQNFRSNRLLDELRAAGLEFEVSTDEFNRFTGRLESINGENVDIKTGRAFRDTWNSRTLARTEVRKFFDDNFDHRSRLWRARSVRQVYSRYRLNRFRGNWFEEASVRRATHIRGKIRSILYGQDKLDSKISGAVGDRAVDENGEEAVLNETQSGEGIDQVADADRAELADLENENRILRRPSPGKVILNPTKFATSGMRLISLFGAADTACQIKRMLNTVVVGSRMLRAGSLMQYGSLFLSAADITLTGEVDAQDIGEFTNLLNRENPETNRDYFGSGSWQWASTGKGTVNGDIRNQYSVGGGLTGRLGELNSEADSVLGEESCDIATNMFVQGASLTGGLLLTGFSFGTYAAVKLAAQGAIEVAKVITEAIVLPMITDMVAGIIITGDEYGDEIAAATVSAYGALNGVMSNNHGMAPVTNEQLPIIIKERDRYIAMEQAEMGIFERYLSPTNHRSITSVAAISMPRSLKASLSSFSSLLRNPLSIVASPAGVIAGNNGFVSAQGQGSQCQDPDIVDANLASDPFCNLIFGETVAALAIDPIDNLQFMLGGGNCDEVDLSSCQFNYVNEDGKPALHNDFGKEYLAYIEKCVNRLDVIHIKGTYSSEFSDFCYGSSNEMAHSDGTIETISDREVAIRDDTIYNFDDLEIAYMVQDGDYEESDHAGKAYAQTGADLAGRVPSLIERFRIQRLDEIMLDGLAEEFTGDFPVEVGHLSREESGLIIGDPYTSSVGIPCDPRTNDIGIYTGYISGNPVEMQLCALPNLPCDGSECIGERGVTGANGTAIVNSRMSGAWYELMQAAIASGITGWRANSTFRTMEHQEELWVDKGMDTAAVGRPGHSSHQAGVAIDFQNMQGPGVISGASCGNRATSTTDRYEWLAANANQFGLKQYASEAWHWDADPRGNRC